MVIYSSFRWSAAIAVALALASATPPASARQGDEVRTRGTRVGAATTVDTMFALARGAFGDQNYALAERYYEDILRRDRSNFVAMLELSNVYERSGRLEYARGLLIRATRIDPNYPGLDERRNAVDKLLVAVLTAEADSLLARGAYDQAMPKLSLHLTIEPDNASVHYKRSLCMFEMGQLDAALTDAEAAVALDPQEAHFVLRDRIVGATRQGTVARLASRASLLARSDNPRNRAQALDLLGEILEIEPHHTWARNEFLRLTEAESDSAPDTSEARGGLPHRGSTAANAVAAVLAALAGFIGRHVASILAFIAVVIVFRSPMTASLTKRLAREPVLAGKLSKFSVLEVLTLLNGEPHTGVLDVRSRKRRGRIYIDRGEPCHCVSGERDGHDALMSLFDDAGEGSFRFRPGPVPLNRTIDTPLSLLLVEQAHEANGTLTRPGVPEAKKSRMKELLDSKLQV